jgi:hypothetical protein
LLVQDLLKRNSFIFRGRASLDEYEIIDCPDGKGEFYLIDTYRKVQENVNKQ